DQQLRVSGPVGDRLLAFGGQARETELFLVPPPRRREIAHRDRRHHIPCAEHDVLLFVRDLPFTVHRLAANSSFGFGISLYCAPMIRTTTLALVFLFVAGAASAAPKCGIFGSACMKIRAADGQVQLNTFE